MNIHTQNKLAKDEEYLNTKELIFINAYVQTGNATQSYIKAFNIPQNRYHSATVLASKLKKKIHSLDQLYYESNGLNARCLSSINFTHIQI